MDPAPISVILVASVSMHSLPAPAPAYLDPGTGSLLIQALIAGIVTVPFILRRRIKSGVARFRRGGGGATGRETEPRPR